jgi:hypothetical protein
VLTSKASAEHSIAAATAAFITFVQAKNAALAAAGAVVPDSFEGLEGAITATYQK